MNIGTQWPWVSMLLAAGAVLNPIGLDILHAAFFSSEQLERNIWQPIALIGIVVLAALLCLEWISRTHILNRRARGAQPPSVE